MHVQIMSLSLKSELNVMINVLKYSFSVLTNLNEVRLEVVFIC